MTTLRTFWLAQALVTASGDIDGQALLRGIDLSPWAAAAAIVPICQLSVVAVPSVRRRNPHTVFWGAIAVLSEAATVFAQNVDTFLGVGDLPASLHVAALLLLAIIVDHRLAGMIAEQS
ncbi:putative membrane-anchored protein [Bradyrhizobium sp. USDA 4501]|uniref:hypothetical protein n=1 Tax=Bradyrhizobium sp. USDA 3458 TaxID=2591461 RepID=UPI001143F4A1|nr:hypothetical protein [Bradyrhizobium sp. USDA 3458]